MDYLTLIVLALAGSLLSLIGGFILLSNKNLAHKIANFSAPFAAGALIAAALVDLMPEAISYGNIQPQHIGIWLLVGMAIFFLLERQLNWFHHHHEHQTKTSKQRIPAMLVVGDTLHNAIDGAAIAITFLADPALGVVTAFAVALHEIPQEIGDFSLLLKAGWSRQKIILVNFFSAVATVVTALIVYAIGSVLEPVLPMALAVTAGALLYIASSDVVPEVHSIKPEKLHKDKVSLLFVLGLAIVSAVIIISQRISE